MTHSQQGWLSSSENCSVELYEAIRNYSEACYIYIANEINGYCGCKVQIIILFTYVLESGSLYCPDCPQIPSSASQGTGTTDVCVPLCPLKVQIIKQQ
jgi:hypothetical protein